MQACCSQASELGLHVFYLPLQESMLMSPDILENLEKFDLLCLDDIDCIANNKQWEEALFHLYNRCQASNTRLIMTGSNLANYLDFSLADLTSRLNAGLSVKTPTLLDNDKTKILQIHAHKKGLELNQSVINFLLRRCSRKLNDLLKILEQLDQTALVEQRKLTVPFVKEILGL